LLYNIERRVNVSTVIEDKKVGDMTARELKSLIRDTIHELIDPDYGLELRPEIEEELRKSLKSKKRTPAEKVASELGLKW
jgi:signal recognition particle GTPase